MRRAVLPLQVALALAVACPAVAGPGVAAPGLAAPRVPLSAFARPAFAIDPARLHVSTMVAVGTGFGGTSALSVTSLSYQFRAPLWLRVSVGSAVGGNAAGDSKPFLEGVSLAWRPARSMLFEIQYQDFRSPLQRGPAPYPYRGY